MISRYSREQIAKIWQPENKYKIWLDIEIYAAEAMEKFKIIPKGIAKEIRKKAKINPDRIDQIEKKVKHDVIAFLTSITEKVGQKAKFLHQGMTSNLKETRKEWSKQSMRYQLVQSLELLELLLISIQVLNNMLQKNLNSM